MFVKGLLYTGWYTLQELLAWKYTETLSTPYIYTTISRNMDEGGPWLINEGPDLCPYHLRWWYRQKKTSNDDDIYRDIADNRGVLVHVLYATGLLIGNLHICFLFGFVITCVYDKTVKG